MTRANERGGLRMRLNYKFSNLCGVVYKQGNLQYTTDGTGLFSPVGGRVTFFDLVNNTSLTFPFELPNNVQRIAVSPNGALMIAVDTKGQGVIVAVAHRVILHHINFQKPVQVLSFSPNGEKLIVATTNRLRVWRTPTGTREFAPLVLNKTIAGGGHTDTIVSVDWTNDSRYFLTASHDMTARIFDTFTDDADPLSASIELCGHNNPLEGAYFSENDTSIITVARNGSVFTWNFDCKKGMLQKLSPKTRNSLLLKTITDEKEDGQEWNSKDNQLSTQNPPSGEGVKLYSKVTAVAFNKTNNLLVTCFENGIFGVYTIDPFENIYTLGITQAVISSIAINKTGEWLALGVSDHGQLLVWEWQSETFIMKQQGHSAPMNSLAYSPDGQTLATGGADGKVKLWTVGSGLCFVTFSEHTAPVTAVEFSKGGKVIVSASSDGTVRAFDLLRYRNFRILTTPRPVQFISLAIDPSGELVAAGTLDTFEIFLWSLQTGQLLEILTGHTGPVSALAFDPIGHRLASGSWDKTVRMWDVFQRSRNVEKLDHPSDILAISFRPDGHHLAAATLSGEIFIWDVELASIIFTLDTRRDYAEKPLSSAALKSIDYSPDGNILLVSGSFPFVAFYDITSRTLLRRFPVTKTRRDKPEATANVVASAVRMSPTSRAFAVLTGEGLVIFSLDETLLFDPFDLEIDITPQRVQEVLEQEKHYLKAFVMALKLNIPELVDQVWENIPFEAIPLIVGGLPVKYLLPTLSLLARLANLPIRLELLLRWITFVLSEHALILRQFRIRYSASLRLLLKNVQDLYSDLGKVSNQTMFTLEVLCDHPLPL